MTSMFNTQLHYPSLQESPHKWVGHPYSEIPNWSKLFIIHESLGAMRLALFGVGRQTSYLNCPGVSDVSRISVDH